MNNEQLLGAVRMDLHRVIYMGGNLKEPFLNETAKTFLTHALSDLQKIKRTPSQLYVEQKIKETLVKLDSFVPLTHERLRWTENIMTLRGTLLA